MTALHQPKRLIAQLNKTWRIIDNPQQWILQRKKGNARSKNSGWKDRSFCRTRDALLRCVREYCGEVEQAALAQLTALPAFHGTQNLDASGMSHVRAEGRSVAALEPFDADR